MVGEPVWAVRWNGPPMASDERLPQFWLAVAMPEETTPLPALTPLSPAGVQPDASARRAATPETAMKREKIGVRMG